MVFERRPGATSLIYTEGRSMVLEMIAKDALDYIGI
jgi:hypothetical protein